jgi:hypothetical protein
LEPASVEPVVSKSRVATEIAGAGSSIAGVRGCVSIVSPAASALDITNAAAAIALMRAGVALMSPGIGSFPLLDPF